MHGIRLNTGSRIVDRDAVRIDLTSIECDLLDLFMPMGAKMRPIRGAVLGPCRYDEYRARRPEVERRSVAGGVHGVSTKTDSGNRYVGVSRGAAGRERPGGQRHRRGRQGFVGRRAARRDGRGVESGPDREGSKRRHRRARPVQNRSAVAGCLYRHLLVARLQHVQARGRRADRGVHRDGER